MRTAFATSGALTVHLRVHSGDKPFRCDACGKAFEQSNKASAQSGTLAKHLRMHMDAP
jgi:hypothetical protein